MAVKVTPSMAKNQMARAIYAIAVPPPAKDAVEAIWKHFKSRCAYCDKRLTRNSRKAHLDHLVSISEGGNNDRHNLVLSCSICNGDEKLDRPWREFLEEKTENLSTELRTSRFGRIQEWANQAADTANQRERVSQFQELVTQAHSSFDQIVQRARALSL